MRLPNFLKVIKKRIVDSITSFKRRNMIRIYLDDLRLPPEGYESCQWPEEVINKIMAGNVELVDLDHDLGDDSLFGRTGMDVLNFLEEWAYAGNKIPRIVIHTANTVAFPIMYRLVNRIYRIAEDKQGSDDIFV